MAPWHGYAPDAKSQVTLHYDQGEVVGVDTVLISTQHHPEVQQKEIEEGVIEEIIKPVMPKELITDKTRFIVNPTGRFVIGGPLGDCGLTGRKIIVDTYGGMARHGGGCFFWERPFKSGSLCCLCHALCGKKYCGSGPC